MDDNQWHLDKKVPIITIGSVIASTIGLTMYVASLEAGIANAQAAAESSEQKTIKLERKQEQDRKEILEALKDIRLEQRDRSNTLEKKMDQIILREIER